MLTIDQEEKLNSTLKDYWTYQKHYYKCYFDIAGFLDFFRDRAINNPQYAGKLCMQVATAFCKASEDEWKKVLKQHGFNNEFYSQDMCFHLNLIMTALGDVDRNKYTDPNMLQAIDMANDPQYRSRVYARKREISPVAGKRSVLKV